MSRGVQRGETAADRGGCPVELFAFIDAPVGADAECVTCEAGDDLEVHMEDLLERRFAIREEQVDALASQP